MAKLRFAWANPWAWVHNHCAMLLLYRQRLLLHVFRQRVSPFGLLTVFYIVKWRESTHPAFKIVTLIWLNHVQKLSRWGWCTQNSWLRNKMWLLWLLTVQRNKIQIHSSGLQVWWDPAPSNVSTSPSLDNSPPVTLPLPSSGTLYLRSPLSPYFCKVSSFPSQLRYHLLREAFSEDLS